MYTGLKNKYYFNIYSRSKSLTLVSGREDTSPHRHCLNMKEENLIINGVNVEAALRQNRVVTWENNGRSRDLRLWKITDMVHRHECQHHPECVCVCAPYTALVVLTRQPWSETPGH